MINIRNIFPDKFNSIFFNRSEASIFIWRTIKNQKINLSLNILSGIMSALLEGLSLAIIYVLVKVCSSNSIRDYDWSLNSFFKSFPFIYNFLNSLSFTYIFIILIVAALAAQFFQSYCKYINLVSTKYIEAKCLSEITKKIYNQVFKFSFKCSSQYKVGDLSEFVIQCPETIRLQIDQLNGIFISFIISITYIVFLINLNAWLFFGIIVIIYISKILQVNLIPRVKKISEEVTNIKVEISKTLVESFQALRFIHSNGLTHLFEKRLNNKAELLDKRLRIRARKITILDPLLSSIPILFISIIGIFLVFTLERQSIFPILATFIIAIQRLNVRLITISTSITILVDNIPRISRLNQIISQSKNEFRRIGGKIFRENIRDITFSDVSFSYDETNKFSLNNLNLSIRLGEVVAIVGKSGSGKSSILDLLVGLYEPARGGIKINGNLLGNYNLDSWQKKISIVSQDTFLFNTSIKNNLTFGLEEVSLNDLKKVCLLSGALKFIQDLPNSFDTIIGERGFKLSGGQRQRLAIARAILRKSQILILDEATSALDSQTEKEIQENIYRLKKEKIILIVAHRLSTIKNADKIIVLKKGEIIDSGTHNELLLKDSTYKMLWDIQSKS